MQLTYVHIYNIICIIYIYNNYTYIYIYTRHYTQVAAVESSPEGRSKNSAMAIRSMIKPVDMKAQPLHKREWHGHHTEEALVFTSS